jgi:tetratricopeptide (TPR) repeat protein
MRYWIGAAALLAFSATPAHATWRQASTDHFVIYSEDSAKTLEEFATRLERFDQAMRYVRGLPDPAVSPSNRLTVFIVPSLPALKKLYGDRNASVGGFYTGRATGSFAFTPRTIGSPDDPISTEQIVLLHEYGHHFMYQSYPGAFPAWLVEGFAEFHSTAKFERDGSVGLGLPANHRAYALLRASPMKIEKVLTTSVFQLKDGDRDSLYARGWLLTHYLTLDPARKGQLSTYVREINSGTASLEAARKAFGDLAELDKALDRYLRQTKLSYLKLPPDRIRIGKVTVSEVTPGADALMELRMQVKRGVPPAEQPALAQRVREAAAAFPGDATAQTTLAEAEYDAENFREAEAAADRALAADPRATEAMVYKGRARMKLAVASGASDAATWREVRKWFTAANRIEADDPEPLILFYESFAAAGQQPTPNASLGLERALELAPQDPKLRMMAAHQFLRDGRSADARAALAPVAFNPHGGGAADDARRIVALLDSSGVKAALEGWRNPAVPKAESPVFAAPKR